MPFAFSAHNQFLQSLSAAGIIGLIGLLLYLIVLGTHANQLAARSGGVTMALFVFMLLRCMTETPMDITGMFSGEFIVHLLLVQLLMCRQVDESVTDKQGLSGTVLPPIFELDYGAQRGKRD